MYQQITGYLKRMTFPLFIRLLLSFIAIILLLLSFFLLSYQMMKNRYHERITSYNQINLERTIDQYEHTFETTKNMLLGLYNKSSIVMLNSELETQQAAHIDPINVRSIHEELSESIQSNPHLMLEDILLVLRHQDIVISKKGSTDASLIFGDYIHNPEMLNEDRWQSLFEQINLFEIFPVALNGTVQDNAYQTDAYAVSVKNPYMKNIYFIALINEQETYARYHHDLSANFWIHQPDQKLIRGDAAQYPEHEFSTETYHTLVSDQYFFMQPGRFTGLIYTDQVPESLIKQEVSRLNFLWIPILLAAIAVSMFISIFFSRRISDPVKRIMGSIQTGQQSVPGTIREFQSIHQYFIEMNRKNREFSQELQHSSSLLRSYALVDQLKSIKTNTATSFSDDFIDRPFVFMLVEVYFHPEKAHAWQQDETRAISFICEFIRQSITEYSAESLTFQMEKNQICSVIFLNKNTENQLEEIIKPIVDTLKLDEDTCLFTIGLSQVHSHSSELTEAYEEGVERLRFRELNRHLQVIHEQAEKHPVFLSSSKEQELHRYLTSANEKDALAWTDHILEYYKTRQATLNDLRELAVTVSGKITQLNHSMNLNPESTLQSMKLIEHCYTYEDFKALLSSITVDFTDQIKQRDSKENHLIDHVTAYLDKHYAEEISLDRMAERLKISPGYLSTSFKEQTGVNFKDYLANIRMNKAKELLKNTDLKIQETAVRVGYQNTNPFIRMFRKHTGMTPSEYRKKSI